LHFVASNLWALPFPDLSFDLVLGVRLLAHVERWQDLLAEMARVCRHRLLIDYPPIICANFFERWIFRWKRDIEGNTRPYFSYSFGELSRALYSLGFERLSLEKQFFVPIVVHRALARQGLSRALERGSRTLGLTRLFGGPVLLCAELPAAGAGLEPRPAKSEARTAARTLLIAPQPFATPGARP
jgi:SAM-dependent methyltransferase